MASIPAEPGAHLRTAVTRVHAICLFVITIAATIASTIGWKGHGPLDVLARQPFGYVGLYQAYFLMFLLRSCASSAQPGGPAGCGTSPYLPHTSPPCPSSSLATTFSYRPLPEHGLPRRVDHSRFADLVGNLRAGLESPLPAVVSIPGSGLGEERHIALPPIHKIHIYLTNHRSINIQFIHTHHSRTVSTIIINCHITVY